MATQVRPELFLATLFIAALQYMAIQNSKYFLTALGGNLQFIISFHGTINTSWQAESQLLIIWKISRFLSKISFSFSSLFFFFFWQILTSIQKFLKQEWQVDAVVLLLQVFGQALDLLVQKSIAPTPKLQGCFAQLHIPFGKKSLVDWWVLCVQWAKKLPFFLF